LPTQFDELNADYSSFTLDAHFPPAVNGGSVDFDSWIMNGQTLFGDSDNAGDSVQAFGSSSLGLSNLGSSADRTGKRGSGGCSSDGSSVGVGRCIEGDLSYLIAASPGGGADAGYEPAQQSSNFPGSNPLFGGANQIPGREMIAGQNSFAMTWPSGVIQGAFPPACCDVTLPVVVGSFAPASDFVNQGGSLNPDPPPDPPGGFLSDSTGTGQGPVVPEIPQWAMLLIGFAGLALIGRTRLSRSGRLG
jgi:hypothetical protein